MRALVELIPVLYCISQTDGRIFATRLIRVNEQAHVTAVKLLLYIYIIRFQTFVFDKSGKLINEEWSNIE